MNWKGYCLFWGRDWWKPWKQRSG